MDQLDCNFSIHEVEKAIGCLKRGESSGEDSLIPEILLKQRISCLSFCVDCLITCLTIVYIPNVGQGE